MAKKEIDYSSFTSQQLGAARLLADPDNKLTNKEVSEAVGISERQLYRWKENREFLDLINDLAEKYMDAFLGEVYREMKRSIKAGSVKAMELYMKSRGKLIERREVQSDVNIEVTAIDGKSNEQILKEIEEMEKRLLGNTRDIIDITPETIEEKVDKE